MITQCVVCAGVFPSAWYVSVRDIAARSPLLLSLGGEKFLDKELEINHPLKIENIAAVRVLINTVYVYTQHLCHSLIVHLIVLHCVDRFSRVSLVLATIK